MKMSRILINLWNKVKKVIPRIFFLRKKYKMRIILNNKQMKSHNTQLNNNNNNRVGFHKTVPRIGYKEKKRMN